MSFADVQRTVAELRAALAVAGLFDRERLANELQEVLQSAVAFRRARVARIEAHVSLAATSRGAGFVMDPAELQERRDLLDEIARLQSLQVEVGAEIRALARRLVAENVREEASGAAAAANVGPGAAASDVGPGAAASAARLAGIRREREDEEGDLEGVARGMPASRMSAEQERRMEALTVFAQTRPEGVKLLGVSSDLAASIRSAGMAPLPPSFQRVLMGATILDRRLGTRRRAASLLSPDDMERVFEERFFQRGVDMTARNNAAIRHCATNGYIRCVRILLRNPEVDLSANDFEAIDEAENSTVLALLLADPRAVGYTTTDNTFDRLLRKLIDVEFGSAEPGFYTDERDEAGIFLQVPALLEPRQRLAGRNDVMLREIEDNKIRDIVEMYRLYMQAPRAEGSMQNRVFPNTLLVECAGPNPEMYEAASGGLLRTVRILLTEYGGTYQIVLQNLGSFALLQMMIDLGIMDDWVPTDPQLRRAIGRFNEDEDESDEAEADHMRVIQECLRRRGLEAIPAQMLSETYQRIPYNLLTMAIAQPAFDVNTRFVGDVAFVAEHPTFFVDRLVEEDYAAVDLLAEDPRFVWTPQDVSELLDALVNARENLDMDDLVISAANHMLRNEQAIPIVLEKLRDIVEEWLEAADRDDLVLVELLLTGEFVDEENLDDEDDSDNDENALTRIRVQKLQVPPESSVFATIQNFTTVLVEQFRASGDERPNAYVLARANQVVQLYRWMGLSDENIDEILLVPGPNFFERQRLFRFFWRRS